MSTLDLATHDQLRNFISTRIIKLESLFYYQCLRRNIDLEILRQKNHGLIVKFIIDTVEKWFTIMYHSLFDNVNHDMQNVMEIAELYGHTSVCMLNIIAKIFIKVHFTINRTNFDISNIESYQKSVINAIDSLINKINIENFIDHSLCQQTVIKPLAADQKFFKIKIYQH